MGIWSALKTVAAPAVVSAFRTGSSAGSSLFSMLNVFKYFGQENHPGALPSSYGTLAINAFTTLTTAVPAIFRQFRKKREAAVIDLEAQNQHEKSPRICANCQCFGCCACNESLSAKGHGIYIAFKTLGMMSGAFASLAFYLGTITLSEFIRKRFSGVDEPIEEWQLWEIAIVESFAVLAGVCNYIYFASYRLKKIQENALRLGKKIDAGGSFYDADFMKALAVASFSLVSSPFTGYFSTSRALAKIPFLPIPAHLIKILASTSAATAVTTTLTSELPSLYDFFKSPSITTNYGNDDPKWEPFTRASVYFVGALDAGISVGLSTFIGVVSTSNELFNVDPKSWWIVVPGVLCATSKTIMGYIFSVRQNYLDTMHDYHQMRGHVAYHLQVDNTEVKNDGTSPDATLLKAEASLVEANTDAENVLKCATKSPYVKSPSVTIERANNLGIYKHSSAPIVFPPAPQNENTCSKSHPGVERSDSDLAINFT